MTIQLSKKQSADQSGFTLIEMLMVMIISSILLTSLIMLYDKYREERIVVTTSENIKTISGQLAIYLSLYDRYPCPADASLSISDPNFGKEGINGSCGLGSMGLSLATAASGVPSCTPSGGICLALGARRIDLDGEATPNQSGTHPDETFVLIGAAPTSTLKEFLSSTASNEIALDGWGNKYTYAVSLNMANPDYQYKYNQGVIAAVDETNNPTAGMVNAAGDFDAHYVIVSHGPDGKGAFNAEGFQSIPCGTVAQARDNENCNNDNAFMQALGYSSNNDAAFYDDKTYFSKVATEHLWEYVWEEDPVAGFKRTDDIQSLNRGNIGIGTDNPRTSLEVATNKTCNLASDQTARAENCGIIRADNNFYATQICDKSTSLNGDGTLTPRNCFRIDVFWQIPILNQFGTLCPAGQIVKKINGTGIQCGTPAGVAAPQPRDCGAGNWVKGIDTNGNIICTQDNLIPEN